MPSKRTSILIGGLVIGVLSTSYIGLINLFCCLGVIIGALVGVHHYTDSHGLTITGGEGASIGALAGLVGAAVSVVLTLLLVGLGLDTGSAVSDFLVDQLAGMMTAEQIEQIEAQREEGLTASGLLTGLLIAGAINAVVGAIGGAVGAALFKKGGSEPTEPEPGY